MARLPEIPWDTAPEKTRELLDQVATGWDLTPAMTQTMALSPAVLQGYLSLRDALQGGTLDPLVRARIGLVVAEANRSRYSLATQAALGWLMGLDEAELEAARWARSADPKVEAALSFAQAIVQYRGEVSDEEFDAVRQAGYTDGEIAEILANVGLHLFTNYFTLVAQTKMPFPIGEAGEPDAA